MSWEFFHSESRGFRLIIGIGVDLIEVHRVTNACNSERFLSKYFTFDEIALIKDDPKKAADNFAVKEAVSKMLGTGFRGFGLIEVEVLRDSVGKPYVNLYGKAEKRAKEIGVTDIFVSISNTKEYANAFVVGERR